MRIHSTLMVGLNRATSVSYCGKGVETRCKSGGKGVGNDRRPALGPAGVLPVRTSVLIAQVKRRLVAPYLTGQHQPCVAVLYLGAN